MCPFLTAGTAAGRDGYQRCDQNLGSEVHATTIAICYGRVSTQGQFDLANSLAAQSDQFIKFAASKDFDLGDPSSSETSASMAGFTTPTYIRFEGMFAFK